jgi:hypothetical protein
MATYKVIQNIEAEDKLVGPLTLKGLVYAGGAALLAFINFRLLITGGLGPFRFILILIFAMPMLLLAVLASPLGREQPKEVWLLSHIRFLLKPRRRVWDQTGLSELVTITVPKKPELHLTKEFSQSEVRSRLKALATTLDSRGWAVKNVTVNLDAQPGYFEQTEATSDRLLSTASLPQDVPVVEIHPSDDIFGQNNPTAQKFNELIKEADTNRRKSMLGKLRSLVGGEDKPTPEVAKILQQAAATPQPSAARVQYLREKAEREAKEQAVLDERLARAEAVFKAERQPTLPPKKIEPPQVTEARQAVNMNLAQSGSDLKVSTLSQMADHLTQVKQLGPNEVEISLH